ncbi:MAG: hypothetical protein KME60_00970 [Cyanomargarita calcarea GSE-NOS-MK-12-04C]|uniref:Uncharacterized protein n=1 Tax=Cyanomargarita calcarea GSE-NOS-MK-12-04C TaxID=2839659 RepID=A0A951QI03_9CYAN|nr:hypothetical protein [Cyanomargarita calcarea GSE-NOS-MK-12-04C]
MYANNLRNTGERAEASSVEPHRFGLNDIYSTLSLTAFNQSLVSTKIAEWKALNLDWQAAVAALNQINANVSYEEIECLGLSSDPEQLVATFRIKRPTGYSGDRTPTQIQSGFFVAVNLCFNGGHFILYNLRGHNLHLLPQVTTGRTDVSTTGSTIENRFCHYS